MPKIELKTRIRSDGRHGPELILDLLLVPRGSGNRAFAAALAKTIRKHPKLSPHVRQVKAGSSRVMVSLTPSVGLMKTIALWSSSVQADEDVPGQLPLFGSASIA
jgi:hypothetical protein